MFCLNSSGKFVGYDFPKGYHIRNYLLASLLPMLHLPLSLLLLSSVAWAIKELLPENKSPLFDDPLTLYIDFDAGVLLKAALARILPDNTALVDLTTAEEECCMGNCSTLTTEQYALLDLLLKSDTNIDTGAQKIQSLTNAALACVPSAKYDHCMTNVSLHLQLEMQDCHDRFGQCWSLDCHAEVWCQ